MTKSNLQDGSPPAAEQICITDSGASAHKPCIFPFKFNGVVYNQCTWVSAHLTEHKVVELETKVREVSTIMR